MFNPIFSILKFSYLALTCHISTNSKYLALRPRLANQTFCIFRHVAVKRTIEVDHPTVLALKFKFHHSSLIRDRIDSFFQIPIFVGLPGFQEKLWTFCPKTGEFQGIYQWENRDFAEQYLNSFAIHFLEKKAIKDSITSQIYPDMTLDEFIRKGTVK